MPRLVKLGVPRRLRHEAMIQIRTNLAQVVDRHAIRTLKLVRHYAVKAFKYRNPQPGHHPGGLVLSLWRGQSKKTAHGAVMVELGSAKFYDDILEHGPQKKTWGPIVPRGMRKVARAMKRSITGPRAAQYTKIRFLRFYIGGKAVFRKMIKKVNWKRASLRPHWAPALKFDDQEFARDCANAVADGVVRVIERAGE